MKKARKKRVLLFLVVALFALTGYKSEYEFASKTSTVSNKDSIQNTTSVLENKAVPETHFIPYRRSLPAHKLLDLRFSFYCSEGDIEKWDLYNISSAYIQIGEKRTKMSYMDGTLVVDTEPVYDQYYSGDFVLSGEFEEPCSGTMYLIIEMRGEDRERKYNVGQCCIVEDHDTEKQSILCKEMGAIANIDENKNLFTYGNILHIKVNENITINRMDFGMQDVCLDAENCKVYSEKEFKNLSKGITQLWTDDYIVYPLRLNAATSQNKNTQIAAWNRVWSDCYKKKQGNTLASEVRIELEKGEYYIYCPFVFKEKNAESVIESVFHCTYFGKENKELHYVSEPTTYFREYTKEINYLNELFEKE